MSFRCLTLLIRHKHIESYSTVIRAIKMDFKGLMAPPVTPVHPDGKLNVDVIPQYVDYLVRNGVDGVYVCGTTGEGTSFTVEERKQIAEAWVKSGKNKLKAVVIQVGGFCLKDTEELAAHAQSIGADGIASLPPLYHKPKNVAELVDFCQVVAGAARQTPFLYYHIPFMTDVNVNIHEFLQVGSSRIPNLAGAKFTSIDMNDLSMSCAYNTSNRKFIVLNGFDQYLGPALLMGCRAAIGATYNFAASYSTKIIKAHESGNLAALEKEQGRLIELMTTIKKHGQDVPLFKAATDLAVPFPVGPPRRPLVAMSSAARQGLAQDMKALGLTVHPNKIQ